MLHRTLFHDHMHRTLHVPCETLRLKSVSDCAEEKRDAEKNIKDLTPEPAHLAESKRSLFLGCLVEPAVTYVDLLRQVRSSGSSLQTYDFA